MAKRTRSADKKVKEVAAQQMKKEKKSQHHSTITIQYGQKKEKLDYEVYPTWTLQHLQQIIFRDKKIPVEEGGDVTLELHGKKLFDFDKSTLAAYGIKEGTVLQASNVTDFALDGATQDAADGATTEDQFDTDSNHGGIRENYYIRPIRTVNQEKYDKAVDKIESETKNEWRNKIQEILAVSDYNDEELGDIINADNWSSVPFARLYTRRPI